VARRRDLPDDWLNDAAKGFLRERGEFAPFLDLSHLNVLTATPEYLLAMKAILARFYPLERFLPKTFFALEEMLEPSD
jgi:hypothetical protein